MHEKPPSETIRELRANDDRHSRRKLAAALGDAAPEDTVDAAGFVVGVESLRVQLASQEAYVAESDNRIAELIATQRVPPPTMPNAPPPNAPTTCWPNINSLPRSWGCWKPRTNRRTPWTPTPTRLVMSPWMRPLTTPTTNRRPTSASRRPARLRPRSRGRRWSTIPTLRNEPRGRIEPANHTGGGDEGRRRAHGWHHGVNAAFYIAACE